MLKTIFISLFLSLSILNGSVITTSSTKNIEGIGHGLSREEAVSEAIVEAIGQMNGVNISKKITSEDISIESSRGDKYSYKYNSKINKVTKGRVDSYKILSVEELFAGKYEARVLVSKTTRVSRYKAPGFSSNSRRKIAIMPFHTTTRNYTIGSKQYSNFKVSRMISQALTNGVTQSRRFAVVDRSYTYDMAKEFNLLKSSEVPRSQRVKLGKKLGADYLLVGTIQSASLNEDGNYNQSTGQSSSKKMAKFIIDYRIIVVGTSQVKFSDTAILEVELNKDSSEDIMFQKAINQVSNTIVENLLSNIYPIKIIKITTSGNIILNQGGTLLTKGNIYNVYKLGERLYDPYTKESLGREEIQIAKIEITKVNHKNSYAQVITDNKIPLKKGYICRKESSANTQKKEIDNKNWRKATVNIEDGGGVRLPFD